MTEIIYDSDSMGKIISVFAIECSIVFGFIILMFFCCTGKLLGSSNLGFDNENKFMFKKYSSKYKLPKEQINALYQKDKNKTDKDNSEKKFKTQYSFNLTNLFGCFKSNNSNNNHVNAEQNNQNNQEENKTELNQEQNKTELNQEETKTELNQEENQKEELLSLETIKKETNIKNNFENKDLDLESGLNLDKIYIVYEFNNMDKSSPTSSFIESESEDEFEELEEFVNMIISSFESKYDKIGVLLKISSPGGSAFKFEHAYLNLLRLRDKKIELVGIVDKIAASGGYMLASACEKIICSRYAIIGSIGVIAQMYNWSELNKKVGLEEKTWTTGSHKYPFPTGSSYTEEDNERMKEMIGETFNIFKSIVTESRNFTSSQLEEILKAKTFPGFEALKLNMVDELEMSSDYLNKLCISNNIWICEKEKKSKSFLDTFLIKSTKTFAINIVDKIYNKMILDKKINNVKLM